MILAKQPSIEDVKSERELIAHIEPADDELLMEDNRVQVIATDEEVAPADNDAAE